MRDERASARLNLGGTALVRTTPRRGADYPVRRRWKQVVVDEERTATPVVAEP